MNVRRGLVVVGALALGVIVSPAGAEAQQQQQQMSPAMHAQICAAMTTALKSATGNSGFQFQLQGQAAGAQKSRGVAGSAKPVADSAAKPAADSAAHAHAAHAADSAAPKVAVVDTAAKPAGQGIPLDCSGGGQKTP